MPRTAWRNPGGCHQLAPRAASPRTRCRRPQISGHRCLLLAQPGDPCALQHPGFGVGMGSIPLRDEEPRGAGRLLRFLTSRCQLPPGDARPAPAAARHTRAGGPWMSWGGCGCPGGAMAVLWGRGCPMSQDVMWILLTSSPSPALSILRPGPPSSPQLHPPWVTLPSDVEVTLSTPHPHPVATAEAPPGGFFLTSSLGLFGVTQGNAP